MSKPVFFRIDGHPLVLYRKPTGDLVAHSDICPHQGASLSSGWVDSQGYLRCAYHGFRFVEGTFAGIPDPETNLPCHLTGKTLLPLWETRESDNMIYVGRVATERRMAPPWMPPEHYDSSFTCISGSRIVAQKQMTVTSNVLDCLHPSYVHSFGSRLTPLPRSMMYQPIDEWSGRSTFTYKPRSGTLSSWMGSLNTSVVVENEWHLPTTTITRVRVGNSVKTVMTKATPVGDNSTVLNWWLYRNFWQDPLGVGDVIMRMMMEMTIEEDVAILSKVYGNHDYGPLRTRYDVTIQTYRRAVNDWRTKKKDAST